MTVVDDVFAVIVTHRDVDRAARCASSLGLPADRVVVVANVPKEPVGPWRTVSPGSPQGYGANLNLGAAQAAAGTRWLLLLNDDVVFEARTLERLVAAGDADATIGAITPALHGEDRRPQVVAFRHPTVRSEIANLLVGPDLLRRVLRRGHSVVASGTGVTHEDWILGAAMLVRSAAFAAVGGFDTRYFMYSEDTQFGLDLHRSGWRSAVLHDAWALHVGATSTSDAHWSELLLASRRRYVRNNWSRPRFAALCLLWLGAQGWNVGYDLLRRRAHGSRSSDVRLRARPPWR